MVQRIMVANCYWIDTDWHLVHLVGFNGTNRRYSSSKRHRSRKSILKGGYIGDRLSPSNTWVFFMGACPVILIGVLWWNLFRMNQWPLMMAFLLLCVRAAGLSLQLSVAPSLPRLVFKIGWDLLFCLLLIGTSGLLLLYDKWMERDTETMTTNEALSCVAV